MTGPSGSAKGLAVVWVLGAMALVAISALHVAGAARLLAWAGERRRSLAAVLGAATLYATTVLEGRLFGGGDLRTLATLGCVWPLACFLLRPRTAPAPVRAASLEPWAVAWTLLTTALVVWATIGTRLWDEPNCHFPVTASIARGVLPAIHPLFPNEAFRYHYAFDVLAALPRAFVGLRTDFAIDVATLVSWGLLVAMARAVGAELGGRRGASLAVVLVPLGSGLGLSWLYRDFYLLELRAAIVPEHWADSVPPPVISNFFQHPQGLGMPLALAVLVLAVGAAEDADPRAQRRRFAIAALLLGLTSLAQIVFFAVLGLVLGLAVLARPWIEGRGGLRRVVQELALLATAPVLAFGLGGFLTPGARAESLLRFGRSYFGEPLGVATLHHLFVFGLPLLLAPLALLRAPDRARLLRLTLLMIVAVGFVVPALVTYERSWDIVKFYGVGAFAANVLLADVLAAARRARAFVPVALAASIAASLQFLVRISVMNGMAGIHPMQFGAPPAVGEALWRERGAQLPRDARLLSTNVDLAVGGGFLTPGFAWREHGDSYMLDRAENDRLTALRDRARRDLDPAALAGLGVTYVVVSPNDVASMSNEGRAALLDPTRFEPGETLDLAGERRTIYRLRR